jgi:hypothetical protein
MLRPGARSDDIKVAIQRVAGSFAVQPVSQTGSFLMQRYILEGDSVIPNEPYEFIPKEYQSKDKTLDFEEDTAESVSVSALISSSQSVKIKYFASTSA